ncbi:MAG: metalloregulator ArsR/SmtB family transcription factor [Spirochaetales bacterium]
MDLDETLKALADPNRLRILNLLADHALCVCDLEEVLGLNQSNLSRHLAKLKQTGLVTATKKGLFIYYARRPVASPYGEVVESLYKAMASDAQWALDRQALAAKKGSPSPC